MRFDDSMKNYRSLYLFDKIDTYVDDEIALNLIIPLNDVVNKNVKPFLVNFTINKVSMYQIFDEICIKLENSHL